MLVGKYIPNLIAKLFDVSREYAQIIYDQTSSPKLDKVLKKWEQEKWASAENRQKLAYIILVELLAYQFASPVRWIQTQVLLFTTFNFERLVELGPSPTLTGMATRTLKTKYETLDGSVSVRRQLPQSHQMTLPFRLERPRCFPFTSVEAVLLVHRGIRRTVISISSLIDVVVEGFVGDIFFY